MRMHCLQHVAFEDLGYIEEWANERQHSVTATKFFENDLLPGLDDFDFIVVLGGPMSIHDEIEHSWLKSEKEFLRKAIDADKKILGICLGAQLLADVLGAKVYPNPEKEIGWFPIKKERGFEILADCPNEFTVFHWHGDTFEIPKNAINLFTSEACKNQAFLYNETILGLQFHLEVSPNSVTAMIENGQHEIISGKYIQTENEIKATSDFFTANKEILYKWLESF